MSELATLTVVANETEAELIRSLLRTEGIESMQRPTDFGAGSLDGVAAFAAREILVSPRDLEAARALIEEAE
jgi:hypothetical protein